MIVLAAAVMVGALIVANIQQFGQAVGGFYGWTCSQCGVDLYCCPGKHLAFVSVPATYQVHAHHWMATHQAPRWSAWKPWQWLAYLLVDGRELQAQRPEAVFPTAHVDGRRSQPEGLQRLATDPQYQRKDELPETRQCTSAPG
jgi:hypothetical protein